MTENLINKIKSRLEGIKETDTFEINDLDLVTAQNLKDYFREDYNVIGPATDEANSKIFKPKYILAFMRYQPGVN